MAERDDGIYITWAIDHVWGNTCNHRYIFVFAPLNEQIDGVPERPRIEKQGGYILEHNPCPIRDH